MMLSLMTQARTFAVLLAVMSVAAAKTSADTLLVPSQYPTIQAAIDASTNGDEIVVAPGTYLETIDFLGKAILVRSGAGPSNTIIDGDGAPHVVACVNGEGRSATLVGFTITGGHANGTDLDANGGGMLIVGSSPTVSSCIFSSNQAAESGGAMCVTQGSNPLVYRCDFIYNTANRGGAIYHEDGSDSSIEECSITDNAAATAGGGIYNTASSPQVSNCTFNDNVSDYGAGMCNVGGAAPIVTGCTFEQNTGSDDHGAIYISASSATISGCTFRNNSGGCIYISSSSPTIYNCSFEDNDAQNGGGMHITVGSSPNVDSCVFVRNWAEYFGGGIFCSSSSPTVTNCTFISNVAGPGWPRDPGLGGGIFLRDSDAVVSNCTITANTARGGGGMYVGSGGGDPLVTNSVFWDNLAEDSGDQIHGYCRVEYCNVMGGYGGRGNINLPPCFCDAPAGDLRLDRNSPCIDAGSNSRVPPGVTTDMDGNPRFVDDAGVDDTGEGTPPIVDMGAYEQQHDSGNDLTLLVPDDFATIQEAIEYSLDGDEVIVAPGVYVESINLLGKAIWVHSSDGPDVTTINGTGAHHVVACVNGEGPGTVLEGFTITGGNANGSDIDMNGGGMVLVAASPVVSNCIFVGNAATEGGGGMFNDLNSAPSVIACAFTFNTATRGGGMANTNASSPTVINGLFINNDATVGGGGIYNNTDCSPVVTNCTFTGNTTEYGGALCNIQNSMPIVTNCILWGNGGGQEVWDNLGSETTITYSNVEGGFVGTGNIDADPQFVNRSNGDFHLSPCSPCIDAGKNSAVPPEIEIDLDGNSRFVNDLGMRDTGVGDPPIVDMGCYEFQGRSIWLDYLYNW